MKGQDIFLSLQYVGEDLIMEAETEGFPAGQRLLRRPVLLAAVIVLMLALVGCSLAYVLKMQNLKIGETAEIEATWVDAFGEGRLETQKAQVLTFSGLKGSPRYEAAREWYQFTQSYDPGWVLYHEYKDAGTLHRAPEEYSLYNIYTPAMQEEIDRITEKYGLKLLGKPVHAVSDDALLAYLNLEGILRPGAKASGEDFNVSYYDGGWFHTDLRMQLTDNPDWPFQFLCSLYYSPRDCFDTMVCELNETSDWQEWNHTTASGEELLVIRSPSVWVSWVFCDRGDATIVLRIETILEWYGDQGIQKTAMTDDQLKQVLECIDFSIQPQPGDPAVLAGPDASREMTQTQNGYAVTVRDVFTDGNTLQISLGIAGPEGTDLEQFMAMEWGGIRFDGVQLTPRENAEVRGSGANHGPLEDNDGKANTIGYYVQIHHEANGDFFREGDTWKLYLDDLLVQVWNRELNQWERSWEAEGIWNFEIPLDKGDWRKLEFVDAPIRTAACTGWDLDGDDVFQEVTVTGLTLRAFGAEVSSTWEQGQLDFSSIREGKFPAVVLKDGTAVELTGDLRIYNTAEDGDWIDLDQVDYLLLMDGTRLMPVQ